MNDLDARSSRFFTVLSSPRRLQVVRILLQAKEMTVIDMAMLLHKTQNHITQIMKDLVAHNIASGRKHGRYTYYRIDATACNKVERVILTLIMKNEL